jgi:hypothetical protein
MVRREVLEDRLALISVDPLVRDLIAQRIRNDFAKGNL